MAEIQFYQGKFFIPRQSDEAQRDKVFRDDILQFAVKKDIIDEEIYQNDWKKIGKLYRLVTQKEGKTYAFEVGQVSPFTGQLIIAILRGEQFYAIIDYNRQSKSWDYSMVSFNYSLEVVYFKGE